MQIILILLRAKMDNLGIFISASVNPYNFMK